MEYKKLLCVCLHKSCFLILLINFILLISNLLNIYNFFFIIIYSDNYINAKCNMAK